MSNYTVTGEQLTAIADAIRGKLHIQPSYAGGYAKYPIDSAEQYILKLKVNPDIVASTNIFQYRYLDSQSNVLETSQQYQLDLINDYTFELPGNGSFPTGTAYIQIVSYPESYGIYLVIADNPLVFPTGFISAIESITTKY